MTIQLIDQSDLEKQRFRCDVCLKEWIAPNRSYVEFHVHRNDMPKPVAGAVEVEPLRAGKTKPVTPTAAATEVVPEAPKRKAGRPRIHPVKPPAK